MASTSQATRVCKGECGETKTIDAFEVTLRHPDGTAKSLRAVCKPCYQKVKAAKAKAKNAGIDRNAVPKPDKCTRCGRGPSEVSFKWRDDVGRGGWRNECNECFNAKGYSATSRAKRRAEDEEAYLRHNATTHLAWAHRNQAKVAAQQRMTKTVPERRWKAIVTYVKQKHGDDWESRVRVDEREGLIARLSEACHYCGHKPVGDGDDELNGLDRVDPNGVYSLDNTVACCGICNSMKLTYSTDEFILNVRKIIAKWNEEKGGDGLVSMSFLPRPRPLGGDNARKQADAKDKTCQLSEDEKINLWAASCYLCGRAPAFGIDRLDALGGYEKVNCRPCCTQCNYMKKDWTLEEFLGHVVRVDMHTDMWVLGDADARLTTMMGERKPVAALNGVGSVMLMFPSAGCAGTVVGKARTTIKQAVELGCKCGGVNWIRVSASEYNRQCIDFAKTKDIIMSIRN